MNFDTSLGIQSEYVVNHLETEIREEADFVVYKTPSVPNYYFGNLLALKRPLSSKSKTDWEYCFDRAFKTLPGIRHRTFVWRLEEDPNTADMVDAFKEAGYEYGEEDVLSMASHQLVVPDIVSLPVELRELSRGEDWLQWLETGVEVRPKGHEADDYRQYRRSRMEIYRTLIGKDHGRFLGAFDGDRLIGYAGVFHLNGLARFQNVEVLPEYQRKGIARALLCELSKWVAQYADRQVIIADAHYHATLLYQSIGFQITEREANLCWWPRSGAAEH